MARGSFWYVELVGNMVKMLRGETCVRFGALGVTSILQGNVEADRRILS